MVGASSSGLISLTVSSLSGPSPRSVTHPSPSHTEDFKQGQVGQSCEQSCLQGAGAHGGPQCLYFLERVSAFQEHKWNVTVEHPECVCGCVVLVVLHNICDSEFCWFLTVHCVYHTCGVTYLFFLWTKRRHLTRDCFSVHMPLLHTHSWISYIQYWEIYCEYNWLSEMKHLQWVIERY